MVFCNIGGKYVWDFSVWSHNPYFNRWFSAIGGMITLEFEDKKVTILILIDGFLQLQWLLRKKSSKYSHNPYFNRWFSAIDLTKQATLKASSHNPYFNRWFSAIRVCWRTDWRYWNVTILILIDGFLQYYWRPWIQFGLWKSQSLF